VLRLLFKGFFRLLTWDMHGAPRWFRAAIVLIGVLVLLHQIGVHGYPFNG
jgi:hypothetical protein